MVANTSVVTDRFDRGKKTIRVNYFVINAHTFLEFKDKDKDKEKKDLVKDPVENREKIWVTLKKFQEAWEFQKRKGSKQFYRNRLSEAASKLAKEQVFDLAELLTSAEEELSSQKR